MEPIKFKEQNAIFAEDQPEYFPLPAHIVNEKEGRVISCWKLTWGERIQILITGKLWASLMTFQKPLQPVYFTTKKSELFNKN